MILCVLFVSRIRYIGPSRRSTQYRWRESDNSVWSVRRWKTIGWRWNSEINSRLCWYQQPPRSLQRCISQGLYHWRCYQRDINVRYWYQESENLILISKATKRFSTLCLTTAASMILILMLDINIDKNILRNWYKKAQTCSQRWFHKVCRHVLISALSIWDINLKNLYP